MRIITGSALQIAPVIAIAVLVLVPTACQPDDGHTKLNGSGHEHPSALLLKECPRSASAEALRIIDVVIRVIAEDAHTVIAPSCPFHPDKDVFSRQNKHKLYEPGQFWRCEFCNKQFRSEAFLDRHMDFRHAHEAEKGSSVCLADFCDTLGCPSTLHNGHHHHDQDQENGIDAAHHHGHDAEHAFSRCVSLLQACLDIDWASERGHEVLDSVVHSFCDRDPCEHGRRAGFAIGSNDPEVSGVFVWGRGHVWVAIVASICLLSATIACCIVYFDDPTSVPFALSDVERRHNTARRRHRDRQQHAFEEEDNDDGWGGAAAGTGAGANAVRRRLGVYGDGAAPTGIGVH